MSTHLHLDLVGGIAGDMTVAALLDAGVDFERLHEQLVVSGLPLTAVSAERTWKDGLAGTRFTVAAEVDPPHRTWRDVRTLLEGAHLDDGAASRALGIFTALAEAEAATHGCDVDEVHFHEVGAMDSIVDIVAAAIGLQLLGPTSFSCSAVPICIGTVETAHGTLPLPAPATARLLTGFELRTIPGTLETVTPTGAAILAHLCPAGPGAPPPMRLTSTGHGLGTATLPGRPNVLRALVGARVDTGQPGAAPGALPGATDGTRRDAVIIEASIDDMDPRVYGHVAAHLFEAGALDVTLEPLQMKKGRPGTRLGIVARPELEGVLSGLVLRETSTLGVRSWDVRRTELQRRHETLSTRFGDVRIKLGLLGDEVLNLAPEYEDCVACADAHGVPVRDVLAAAAAAADARFSRPEARR